MLNNDAELSAVGIGDNQHSIFENVALKIPMLHKLLK